ncbi:zinc finger BED domain-containing protein 4-like [Bacillus rossius redtenbacheri]|uniref:zinc finger BED domain-containing protein 4-like n=1 Tax=Bacillus rossius redtenbacheri TaxID=93214 RepID=UPI002FDCCA2E
MSSEVWEHFSVYAKDPNYAVCKYCKQNISRGGKSQTTSAMKKHLKKHPVHVRAASRSVSSSNEIIGENVAELKLVETETDSSSKESQPGHSKSIVHQTQPTLKDFIAKREKFKPGDTKSANITKLIGKMICLDRQPFSVVEDKGFNALVDHLEPRYAMPSRKYFANKVIPSMYAETVSSVQKTLSEAEFVSVTMDLWTSTANDDYLGVTVHFIDRDFCAQHICIEVVPFPEISHSAQNICSFLTRTLVQWEINDKVFAVVRDNARNVVAALNLSSFNHIPCLAHTLQLVIKDGLLSSKMVAAVTGACRRMVGHFKHSSHATKVLREAQKTVGSPAHRLVQDEPTRWNSILHMLERLYEQRRALALAATNLALHVEISVAQWELIENIIPILKIFDQATLQASKAGVNSSEIIPIVNSLLQELKKPAPVLSGLQGVKNDLFASLTERYRTLEEEEVYVLSTLLDPRFKGAVFTSKEKLDRAVELLTTAAQKLDLHKHCGVVQKQDGVPIQTGSSSGIWSLYSQIMPERLASIKSDSTAVDEVTRYLRDPTVNPDTNILEYWKTQSACLPRLHKLSKKYLCSPPATVFSERLFSTTGNICDQKRNHLDPERVKMLVFFLNKNLKG